MNKNVENYIQNRIRKLECERQTLQIAKDNYGRSVKRTLEMLIYAYGLDKRCVIDHILGFSTIKSNVIGKLEVVKNEDYNKNNELLPYFVRFKADSSVQVMDGKHEWSYPYLENGEQKTFTITCSDDTPMEICSGFGYFNTVESDILESMEICSGFGYSKVVKSDILEYFKKYVLSRVTAFKEA